MTPFLAFCFWLGMIWLIYQCKVAPLQPDKLEDDLGDLDMTEYRRTLREQAYWDEPCVNVMLSRRGKP